jgi:hypothetical protein
MNLKIMRLVLRMQYSTIPAAPPGQLDGVRMTVDRVPQIPRRPPGSRLRRGLTYRDGLRLDLHVPVTAGPHPLVVYVPPSPASNTAPLASRPLTPTASLTSRAPSPT